LNQKNEYHYTQYKPLSQDCSLDKTFGIHRIAHKKVVETCQCPAQDSARLPEKFDEPVHPETRAQLLALKTQLQSWSQCATHPLDLPIDRPEVNPLHPSDFQSCASFTRAGRRSTIALPLCSEPNGYGCTYHGNTNHLAGPFCLLGDEARCQDLIDAQDPVTGAWYRSPYHRLKPTMDRGQPTFSRDELLGSMYYWAKTKNKNSALKWLRFLENNPKKKFTIKQLPIRVLNICPPLPVTRPADITEEQWSVMQPDDRCEMRPNLWPMMYDVLKYIDVTDWEIIKISPWMFAQMTAFDPVGSPTLMIESIFNPITGSGGYQGALTAKNLFLRHYLREGDASRLDKRSSARMNKRSDYSNPFYHWLGLGGRATELGAQMILKVCPRSLPRYGATPNEPFRFPSGAFFGPDVFFYNSVDNYGSYQLPIGHDCVAWINLYTQ
jgi:hypothetical protein